MSAQAKTLLGRYYTDPEVFWKEIETLFLRMWISSGREEQIPNAGDYYLCEVAGESIIVTRESAGGVKAFYNVCSIPGR